MKVKPLYIYLALFVGVIIFIVVFSNYSNENEIITEVDEMNMPDDDIHKGISPPGNDPSAGNVSSSFKHQLEMLKKKADDNPDDTASVKLYADMLNSSHQQKEAVRYYESILKIDPNRIDILLGVTFAHYNLNELGKAEMYTKKILSLNKDHHEANFNLGAIEAAKGNKEAARKIWEDVMKRFPNTQVAAVSEDFLKKL